MQGVSLEDMDKLFTKSCFIGLSRYSYLFVHVVYSNLNIKINSYFAKSLLYSLRMIVFGHESLVCTCSLNVVNLFFV